MCFRDHEVPLAVCALGCVLKCAAILTRLFLNQLPQGTCGHSILPDFPTCPPARAPSSYSLKWLLNTFSQLSCCVHSTPPILLTPVKRGNQHHSRLSHHPLHHLPVPVPMLHGPKLVSTLTQSAHLHFLKNVNPAVFLLSSISLGSYPLACKHVLVFAFFHGKISWKTSFFLFHLFSTHSRCLPTFLNHSW